MHAQSQHWWQLGVVYQIYPRSFMDSNGDGIGDLSGIISRLDYLTWLGVDAIWLSPIYASPMADFGYDITDHTDVHPMFGTLADVDALIAAAHRRNLKVIMDFVPNHTADQHPWFAEARAGRDSPKRDWYIWRDPAPDGGPPNNWLSVFGGRAWTYDAPSRQYYMHSFLPSMPDLNWRNPAVQAAMFDVVRFWLDRGVDGLRVDAAHYIVKDAQFRDNPPNPAGTPAFHRAMGAYDEQLHLYDKADPAVHDVYRALRQVLDSYGTQQPRIAIGEVHIFDWPIWASYYGVELDELHMPYNFGLLSVPWQAQAVRQVVDTVEQVLPAGAWPNYVLGNHDESRLATRIGPAQARVGMLLLLTLRGTPTIYYGDEIGMQDVAIAPEQAQDPWGKNVPGLGRDPQRTPMQWDGSTHAGFSSASPWLPVAPQAAQVNVTAQQDDPRSILTLTRRLLALRRTMPALTDGRYQVIDGAPATCFVYLREAAGQRLLVALNFTHDEQLLRLPDVRGTILLSSHLDRTGPVALEALRLRGDEGLIVQLEDAA